MDSNYIKIDEVSKKSGLSKRAIRYYEELGILSPVIRSEGGYRLYTVDHVEYLKKISVTKEVLGLTLQELQEFISLKDELEDQKHEYRQTTDLKKRKERLNQMIDIANNQINIIEKKLNNIHSVQSDLIDFRKRAQNLIKELDTQN